jgi:disulfide bond formation protein DsbB
MMSGLARKTTFVLLALFLQSLIPCGDQINQAKDAKYPGIVRGCNAVFASEDADEPHIEWFKRELRISPKYLERQEGVLGLSWAHFLTMVFLTVSFIVALLAVIVRHRRTKELLALLLEKEKENESES